MKKIIYFAIVMAVMFSCEQPEVGYISDNIHALEDTVFVPRGIFVTSAAPAAEGSTYPLHWEVTSITDANGKPTNDLLEMHEITTWKAAFNPDTDKTLASVEAKLESKQRPSLLLNDVSGQMAFTQATKNVTKNNIYMVNVKASNVRGERQLNNFFVVKLLPFRPVEFPTEMRSRINLVGKNGTSLTALATSTIMNDLDAGVPAVLKGTHPYITILKVSDEPKRGVKVKMIIADSKGVPFNPSKIIFNPSGATYLQNFHDNSLETVSDATGSTFSLPLPPFPQFGRTYATGTNSYLMYYMSTRDAFTVDKAAWEADKGAYNWSNFLVDPVTKNIVCQAYIRWGIKINDSGTWEIKMKIPYSKAL